MKLSFNASILTIYFSLATLSFSKSLDGDLYFETDVRPILKAQCFHCHGEEDEKRRIWIYVLLVNTRWRKSGRAITPSDIENSILWEKYPPMKCPKAIKNYRPPKERHQKLDTSRCENIRPEPENVADALYKRGIRALGISTIEHN